MKFTIINCTGNDYWQVHRAGCRDIAKVRKNGQYDVEAETVEVAVAAQVAELDADDMGFTAEDFRVLPCARQSGGR